MIVCDYILYVFLCLCCECVPLFVCCKIDDENYDDESCCEIFRERALGSKCRALKCTLLIIFNLFLLACTIGLLVPFILYLREEVSTSIPLIVMFAVCSCSCVCFNFLMCTYFGCYSAVAGITLHRANPYDDN